jgi:N,N'-diacetylchitobiose transport system permease protein
MKGQSTSQQAVRELAKKDGRGVRGLSSRPAAVRGAHVRAPRPRRWRRSRGRSGLTLPVLLLLPAMIIIARLVGYPLCGRLYCRSPTRGGHLIYGTSTGSAWRTSRGLHRRAPPHVAGQHRVFRHAVRDRHDGFASRSRCCSTRRLHGNGSSSRIRGALPWAVPAIAASAIWRWLFNDRYGFVNWGLTQLGFSHFKDYAWFADRNSAFVAIFVTVVWQSFPFIALSLWAGLQTLPQDTLAAARADGATAWQRFRLVTFPLLRPIIAVLVIFSTIWDFKIFDQVYVMAQGVPERDADTAAVTAYREGFALGHYGEGAAIAVILFGILLLFSIALRAAASARRATCEVAAQRGWMYAGDDRRLGLRAVPRLLGRDHVAEAAREIYTRTPDLWPNDPQWHQYPRVLGEGHVGRALLNSLIVASATMVICVVVARWRPTRSRA